MRTCPYARTSASVIRGAMPRCRNSRRVVVQRCPAVPTDAEEHRAQHQIGIGVVHHDDAVVAAEFQNRAAQPVRDHFGDAASHFGGTREADQWNARIFHQHLADRIARPDHEVEDALQPVPVEHAIARSSAPRSPASGVSDEGRHSTQSPHTAAIIAFHAHTATGKLNALITPTTPSGCHCSYIRWPGRSLCMVSPYKLAREADREIADVDHLLHFAQALGQNLAHLERNQRAQILFVGAQFVADLAHDFAALRRRNHAPLQEGRGGALHHGFVIAGAGRAHARQQFAGRGTDGSEFAARGFGDPVAVTGAGIYGFDVKFFEDSETACRQAI